MDSTQKSTLLAELERSSHALRSALQGMSEEQSGMRPAPDRWSVRECVEHLAVAEESMLKRLEAAVPAAEPVGTAARETHILERLSDRSRRFQAPEAAEPRGSFATLAGALRRFESVRARTVRFVEGCDMDLRQQASTHPALGAVNGQELLLMMVMHPVRHAGQIAEIREQIRGGCAATAASEEQSKA
jgi:uncharacterized damage-inducible protein DinB